MHAHLYFVDVIGEAGEAGAGMQQRIGSFAILQQLQEALSTEPELQCAATRLQL